MAKLQSQTSSRKASSEQAGSIRDTLSSLPVDDRATASLDTGDAADAIVYAGLPDEERDALKKVDVSVLTRKLVEVTILDEEAAAFLTQEQKDKYIKQLTYALEFYIQYSSDVARELGNAMELILNQREEKYGSSSQRSSSLTGKGRQNGKIPGKTPGEDPVPAVEEGPDANTVTADEQAADTDGAQGNSTDGSPDKKRPRRRKGCAEKVFENASTEHIDCTISPEELDARFGPGGWKEMTSAEREATEYVIIPAKIVVRIYHLHAYCAADCTDPAAPGIVRAKSPVNRLRPKSPVSSGLMAEILYERSSLRIPPERICSKLSMMDLDITPQRLYNNLDYYSKFFRCLLERLWILLLSSHYIQIDETPVRYFDKKLGKAVRGYMWVFTSSEMLIDGHPITLFYFAQGRDAEVLRQCLQGFSGVIGSDGHSAYQLFARESDGEVTNAGCLDHFRKRLVYALRAVPGLKDMTEAQRLEIPAYVMLRKLGEVFRLERVTKTLPSKQERDEYRNGPVRDAFNELVVTTLGFDPGNYPVGSYTSKAIRYMQNQEVYLEKFLSDSNIASNNSRCERKFTFFAILRNQIKMFGSFHGAEVAAVLESIEQTARESTKALRYYYQYLLDRLIPFIRENGPDTDYSLMTEIDRFLPWADEFRQYRDMLAKREEVLIPLAGHF